MQLESVSCKQRQFGCQEVLAHIDTLPIQASGETQPTCLTQQYTRHSKILLPCSEISLCKQLQPYFSKSFMYAVSSRRSLWHAHLELLGVGAIGSLRSCRHALRFAACHLSPVVSGEPAVEGRRHCQVSLCFFTIVTCLLCPVHEAVCRAHLASAGGGRASAWRPPAGLGRCRMRLHHGQPKRYSSRVSRPSCSRTNPNMQHVMFHLANRPEIQSHKTHLCFDGGGNSSGSEPDCSASLPLGLHAAFVPPRMGRLRPTPDAPPLPPPPLLALPVCRSLAGSEGSRLDGPGASAAC